MDLEPGALAGYVIYCADAAARTALLRSSAARVLSASELGPVRLWSPGEAAPTTAKNPNVVDVALVQRDLKTEWAGRVAVVANGAVGSTQDVLRGPFRGLDRGALALAPLQTSGRGRAGTQWTSPTGAIAFSMNVHVPAKAASQLVFLQYAAAMAIVDAVRTRWGEMAARMVGIKWPNDIVVAGGGKVAGVLCEASGGAQGFDVAVGVGVNFANESPGASLYEVICTATDDRKGEDVTREAFLRAYLVSFEGICEAVLCPAGGFMGAIEKRYLKDWIHSQQEVLLEDEGVRASVSGIASSGAVRVCRPDGTFRDLPPDVTSLDLNKGVLKKKEAGPSSSPNQARKETVAEAPTEAPVEAPKSTAEAPAKAPANAPTKAPV